MDFLANTWWVWLIGSGGLYAYAVYNQISRMRRIMNGASNFILGNFGEATNQLTDGFLRGMFSMAIAALAGTILFVLFVVGIIARLVG